MKLRGITTLFLALAAPCNGRFELYGVNGGAPDCEDGISALYEYCDDAERKYTLDTGDVSFAVLPNAFVSAPGLTVAYQRNLTVSYPTGSLIVRGFAVDGAGGVDYPSKAQLRDYGVKIGGWMLKGYYGTRGVSYKLSCTQTKGCRYPLLNFGIGVLKPSGSVTLTNNFNGTMWIVGDGCSGNATGLRIDECSERVTAVSSTSNETSVSMTKFSKRTWQPKCSIGLSTGICVI